MTGFRFVGPPSWMLLALGFLTACGKDSTGPRTPTKLEIVGGNNQSGQAGTALPQRVAVRASDGDGPIDGVTVTLTTEADGGGSAAPSTLTTGTDGQAETTWTLGSKLGTQTLTFSATGVTPVGATAQVTAGEASLVFAVSDVFQSVVVSRAVTTLPRVKVTDLFGNPLPGVPVTFEVLTPGSVISGSTPVSGANGEAGLGSWTIGPDAVSYTVRARIPSGGVVGFQAQGIPATFTIAAGDGQVANAGTAVSVAPAVRAGRDDGSPLPNVSVSFAVTGGGGSVTGTPVLTGADGIARATRWVLGTVPGPNTVAATASGKAPVTLNATGVAGTAAALTAGSPIAQSAFFGNFVTTTPSVTVTDGSGKPVAGTPVTFQITQGDGTITGATQSTGFDGTARLSSWRLGNAATHAVQATSGAFAPVTFTASASAAPPSTFTLEVRFVSPPTPVQQAAFDQAAARWKQVIISGGAPYPVNEPAAFCYPALNETVPGVVIFATLGPIDGVNGIVGQAGPCIVRDDPMYLPAVGMMKFDTADLDNLGIRLNDVILHEMGHVLGFGTLWNFLTNALLSQPGSGDPFFNGAASRGAFLAAAATGTTFTGNPVPVENVGGAGTRDAHWREATVTTELMTGFISAPGIQNPLSAFTATSFRDMGYVVNDAVADAFTFQAALMAALAPAPLASPLGALRLVEAPLPDPILVINRHGRVVRRVPRF